MTDTDSYSPQSEMPPKRLVSENHKTPSKLLNSHFMYKALSIALVLVVLPLFPSQAPDFINDTIFTRSWELLHLLVVGVAVSYGLFCRRNVDNVNEIQLKPDTTQTYVSRILQVSSVFDDEFESQLNGLEGNETRTWNNNYFRGEPDVVVEGGNPILDAQSGTVSNGSGNKPLFLPVRSLRSSVSDSDSVEFVDQPVESLGSISRPTSGPRSGSFGGSGKNRNREFSDLDHVELEEKLKESVVLPSPIPWRSRSGRMEMKEETNDVNPPPYSLPPSVDGPELDQHEFRSIPSPVHKSSRPNRTSPSPKRLSPSNSLSPEMRAKNIEDVGKKKKNVFKSSTPPPPPPPLPTSLSRRSPAILSNSRLMKDDYYAEKKVVKRSFSDELRDVSNIGREDFQRETRFGIDALKSEPKHRNHLEASLMGKSVRTIRGNEPIAETRKYKEYEERADGKSEKRSNELDRDFVDKPRRKAGGFYQQPIIPENQNPEVPRTTPKPTLPKYQKKEKKKLADKVILESEEYSVSDTDDMQGNSDTEKAASDIVSDAGPDPNEVDKKADEFIAKFREQIRLQRIESIKKSSGQHS